MALKSFTGHCLLGCACMCVHAHSPLCVCVCMCVYLGISFANLMKLIMDPIFSLRYFPDLTDKNSALPDLVEVFQSGKAKYPGSPQLKQLGTYADAECYPSGSACC